MAIFVVFRVFEPSAMEAALQKAFPGDHLKIHSGEYLVSSNGTSKEIYEKLDAEGGGIAIVF
jgi:hypothetical protein